MRRLTLLLLILWMPPALAEPSRGCAADSPMPSGEHRLVMDDLSRRYLLDLPTPGSPTPAALVLALHGYTGSPEIIGAPTSQALVDHASENGYVLVRPASTTFDTTLNAATAKAMGFISDQSQWPDFPESRRTMAINSWNDLAASGSDGPAGQICLPDADTYPCPPECGECGPCVWATCHDDVGFIEALVAELDQGVCFDHSSVFVLGHSNGGMMAQALTCSLPDLFAGGASIKGQPEIGYACGNAEAPSFIQIAGAKDTTVPYDGSPASDGYLYESSYQSALTRAEALDCARGPREVPTGVEHPVSCRLWDQCQGDKRIADCVDPNGDHEWPGSDSHGQWGMELIWGFFSGAGVFHESQGD